MIENYFHCAEKKDGFAVKLLNEYKTLVLPTQIMYTYVLELFLSLFEVFKGVSESFNVCVFASWEGCSGRYEDKHKLNSTAKSQSLKVPGFEYEV